MAHKLTTNLFSSTYSPSVWALTHPVYYIFLFDEAEHDDSDTAIYKLSRPYQ